MTREEMVSTWLSIPKNREGLPTVSYPEPVYNFIQATCEVFPLDGYPNVYNINGWYHKIKYHK